MKSFSRCIVLPCLLIAVICYVVKTALDRKVEKEVQLELDEIPGF